MKIEHDKSYQFSIEGQASFGALPDHIVMEILGDGRVGSHFLERHLPLWFPELQFVTGCKDHDHINPATGIQYDQKCFTKRGCKFMPSSMIGSGRKFNKEKFLEKSEKLTYIICDITQLPKIAVVFKKGDKLAQTYPNGQIPLNEHFNLFNGEDGDLIYG